MPLWKGARERRAATKSRKQQCKKSELTRFFFHPSRSTKKFLHSFFFALSRLLESVLPCCSLPLSLSRSSSSSFPSITSFQHSHMAAVLEEESVARIDEQQRNEEAPATSKASIDADAAKPFK
jgi:hypothetical protein